MSSSGEDDDDDPEALEELDSFEFGSALDQVLEIVQSLNIQVDEEVLVDHVMATVNDQDRRNDDASQAREEKPLETNGAFGTAIESDAQWLQVGEAQRVQTGTTSPGASGPPDRQESQSSRTVAQSVAGLKETGVDPVAREEAQSEWTEVDSMVGFKVDQQCLSGLASKDSIYNDSEDEDDEQEPPPGVTPSKEGLKTTGLDTGWEKTFPPRQLGSATVPGTLSTMPRLQLQDSEEQCLSTSSQGEDCEHEEGSDPSSLGRIVEDLAQVWRSYRLAGFTFERILKYANEKQPFLLPKVGLGNNSSPIGDEGAKSFTRSKKKREFYGCGKCGHPVKKNHVCIFKRRKLHFKRKPRAQGSGRPLRYGCGKCGHPEKASPSHICPAEIEMVSENEVNSIIDVSIEQSRGEEVESHKDVVQTSHFGEEDVANDSAGEGQGQDRISKLLDQPSSSNEEDGPLDSTGDSDDDIEIAGV